MKWKERERKLKKNYENLCETEGRIETWMSGEAHQRLKQKEGGEEVFEPNNRKDHFW